MRRSKSTEPRLALQSPPAQRSRTLSHTRRPRNGGPPPSPRPYLYDTPESHDWMGSPNERRRTPWRSGYKRARIAVAGSALRSCRLVCRGGPGVFIFGRFRPGVPSGVIPQLLTSKLSLVPSPSPPRRRGFKNTSAVTLTDKTFCS